MPYDKDDIYDIEWLKEVSSEFIDFLEENEDRLKTVSISDINRLRKSFQDNALEDVKYSSNRSDVSQYPHLYADKYNDLLSTWGRVIDRVTDELEEELEKAKDKLEDPADQEEFEEFQDEVETLHYLYNKSLEFLEEQDSFNSQVKDLEDDAEQRDTEFAEKEAKSQEIANKAMNSGRPVILESRDEEIQISDMKQESRSKWEDPDGMYMDEELDADEWKTPVDKAVGYLQNQGLTPRNYSGIYDLLVYQGEREEDYYYNTPAYTPYYLLYNFTDAQLEEINSRIFDARYSFQFSLTRDDHNKPTTKDNDAIRNFVRTVFNIDDDSTPELRTYDGEDGGEIVLEFDGNREDGEEIISFELMKAYVKSVASLMDEDFVVRRSGFIAWGFNVVNDITEGDVSEVYGWIPPNPMLLPEEERKGEPWASEREEKEKQREARESSVASAWGAEAEEELWENPSQYDLGFAKLPLRVFLNYQRTTTRDIEPDKNEGVRSTGEMLAIISNKQRIKDFPTETAERIEQIAEKLRLEFIRPYRQLVAHELRLFGKDLPPWERPEKLYSRDLAYKTRLDNEMKILDSADEALVALQRKARELAGQPTRRTKEFHRREATGHYRQYGTEQAQREYARARTSIDEMRSFVRQRYQDMGEPDYPDMRITFSLITEDEDEQLTREQLREVEEELNQESGRPVFLTQRQPYTGELIVYGMVDEVLEIYNRFRDIIGRDGCLPRLQHGEACEFYLYPKGVDEEGFEFDDWKEWLKERLVKYELSMTILHDELWPVGLWPHWNDYEGIGEDFRYEIERVFDTYGMYAIPEVGAREDDEDVEVFIYGTEFFEDGLTNQEMLNAQTLLHLLFRPGEGSFSIDSRKKKDGRERVGMFPIGEYVISSFNVSQDGDDEEMEQTFPFYGEELPPESK